MTAGTSDEKKSNKDEEEDNDSADDSVDDIGEVDAEEAEEVVTLAKNNEYDDELDLIEAAMGDENARSTFLRTYVTKDELKKELALALDAHDWFMELWTSWKKFDRWWIRRGSVVVCREGVSVRLDEAVTTQYEFDGTSYNGMVLVMALALHLNPTLVPFVQAAVEDYNAGDTRPLPYESLPEISLGNARHSFSAGVYVLRSIKTGKFIIGFAVAQGFIGRLNGNYYSSTVNCVAEFGPITENQRRDRDDGILFNVDPLANEVGSLTWISRALETWGIVAFDGTGPSGLNVNVADPGGELWGSPLSPRHLRELYKGALEATRAGKRIPAWNPRSPEAYRAWYQTYIVRLGFTPADMSETLNRVRIRRMAALADNYQYTMFPPLPHDAFIGRRPPLRVSGILFKLGNRHLTVAARGGVIVRANQPHQTIQGEDLIEYLDFEASLRRFKLRNPTLSLVQEAYGGLVSKIQAKVHPKISGVGPGTARYRRLRQPPVGAINPDFHCFSNAIWQVMYRTTFPEALEKALPADVALAPAGSLELAREVLAFFDKLGSSSRPVLHQSLYDSYFGPSEEHYVFKETERGIQHDPMELFSRFIEIVKSPLSIMKILIPCANCNIAIATPNASSINVKVTKESLASVLSASAPSAVSSPSSVPSLQALIEYELVHAADGETCANHQCKSRNFKPATLPLDDIFLIYLEHDRDPNDFVNSLLNHGPVSIPMTLELPRPPPSSEPESESQSQSEVYELRGIVRRHSTPIATGHFIAIVGHKGTWYTIDDQVVSLFPGVHNDALHVELAVQAVYQRRNRVDEIMEVGEATLGRLPPPFRPTARPPPGTTLDQVYNQLLDLEEKYAELKQTFTALERRVDEQEATIAGLLHGEKLKPVTPRKQQAPKAQAKAPVKAATKRPVKRPRPSPEPSPRAKKIYQPDTSTKKTRISRGLPRFGKKAFIISGTDTSDILQLDIDARGGKVIKDWVAILDDNGALNLPGFVPFLVLAPGEAVWSAKVTMCVALGLPMLKASYVAGKDPEEWKSHVLNNNLHDNNWGTRTSTGQYNLVSPHRQMLQGRRILFIPDERDEVYAMWTKVGPRILRAMGATVEFGSARQDEKSVPDQWSKFDVVMDLVCKTVGGNVVDSSWIGACLRAGQYLPPSEGEWTDM